MSEYFKVIGEYKKNISLERLRKNLLFTKHMKNERKTRYETAINCLDEDDIIEKTFVIDTGHFDGEELHCITRSGIIFILNLRKYEDYLYTGVVTILIARLNQLNRYDYEISEYTRQKAILHEQQGLNEV